MTDSKRKHVGKRLEALALGELNTTTLKRLKKAIVCELDNRSTFTVTYANGEEEEQWWMVAIEHGPPSRGEDAQEKKQREEYFAVLHHLNLMCGKHHRTVLAMPRSALIETIQSISTEAECGRDKTFDWVVVKYALVDQSTLSETIDYLKDIKDPGGSFRCNCGDEQEGLGFEGIRDMFGLSEHYKEEQVEWENL